MEAFRTFSKFSLGRERRRQRRREEPRKRMIAILVYKTSLRKVNKINCRDNKIYYWKFE